MKEKIALRVAVAVLGTLIGLALNTARGQVIEEHVVNLPEYAGKYYLTVVYSDRMTDHDLALSAFMKENPSMRALASQTVYHQWWDSSPAMQKTAWKKFIGPERPALLLQGKANKNGRARSIFFVKGASLPINDNLPIAIQAAIDRDYEQNFYGCAIHGQRCPDGRCPRPRPQPVDPPYQPPAPDNTPDDVQPIPPSIIDDEPPADEGAIPLWWFAIPFIGPLVGAGRGVKEGFAPDGSPA